MVKPRNGQRNGRAFINPLILTTLRERQGYSIRGLARRADLAPSTISRIERSIQLSNPATTRAIAKALRTREAILTWR